MAMSSKIPRKIDILVLYSQLPTPNLFLFSTPYLRTPNSAFRILFDISFALQPFIEALGLVHAVHDQMCRHSC